MTLSVHILPFAFTAILFWLGYCSKYWFPESGLHNKYVNAKAQDILNWLQLAAKLYEIIVIGSLAAVALEAFKIVLHDTGVPFGCLSAPYRIGDVSLLVSLSFWKAVFKSWRSIKAVALSALIITSTLLSMLVGPASAILIVPELDWFPFLGALSDISPVPLFYNGTLETIWPAYLNESLWEPTDGPIHYCSRERASVMYQCPAGGFPSFRSWANGWESTGFPDHITFQDSSAAVSRRLEMSSSEKNGTFATIPTALTAITLGQFKRYVETKKKKTKAFSQTDRWKIQHDGDQAVTNLQPLVQAKCNISTISNAHIDKHLDLTFPPRELRCFSKDIDDHCHRIRNHLTNLTIPGVKIGNSKRVLYRIQTTDTALRVEESPTNPSTLIFVASLPYMAPNDDLGGVHLLKCSYMAHWVPSVPDMDFSNAEMIKTHIVDVGLFFNHTNSEQSQHKFQVGSTINLQKSWLPFFHLSMVDDAQKADLTWMEAPITAAEAKGVNMNNEYTIGSLLRTMMLSNSQGYQIFGPGTDFHNGSDSKVVKEAIEKFTSDLLADAISRTAVTTPAFLMTSGNSENATLDQLSRQQGPNSYNYTLLNDWRVIDGRGNNKSLLCVPGKNAEEWNNPAEIKNDICQNCVTVEFEAKQYGYGFGKLGAPQTFARIVILTYCGIISCCLFLMLVFGEMAATGPNDWEDLLGSALKLSVPPWLKGKSRIEAHVTVKVRGNEGMCFDNCHGKSKSGTRE